MVRMFLLEAEVGAESGEAARAAMVSEWEVGYWVKKGEGRGGY